MKKCQNCGKDFNPKTDTNTCSPACAGVLRLGGGKIYVSPRKPVVFSGPEKADIADGGIAVKSGTAFGGTRMG